MTANCLSCAVADGLVKPPGGVILERHGFVLAHAVDTPVPGFLVLSSKRHIESLAELQDDEARELGGLLRSVSSAIIEALNPERVYCCSVGENIRHVHFYFFPRYTHMASLGRGVEIFPKAVQLAKRCYSMEEKAAEIEAAVSLVRGILMRGS